MQTQAAKKLPATGAERGKLFRARQRAKSMPTDAQLDRAIRQVLVHNIASADMTPAKVISAARDRLLKSGFSWQGVNTAILKHGEAK
jgi:hypothetical protein